MNLTDCPDPWADPETRVFLNNFFFWFIGVFYCSLGTLGVIGNLVTIWIFTSADMRR